MKLILRNLTIAAIALLYIGAGSLMAQDAEPDMKIIRMIVEEERYDEARQLIEKRMSADPKNPENYFLEGILELNLEHYQEAKDLFTEGIEVKSKYVYNQIGLARAYNRLGMVTERDAVMEKVHKLNKKEGLGPSIFISTAYIEANEMKKAEILLYRVEAAYPTDPRPYIMHGEMYMAKNNHESAKVKYEKAIELDPNFFLGYLRLGVIEIIEKNWNEGLKYLNTAIEKKPDLAPAYRERGELYLKAGKYEKAKDDYEKYVSLLPHDTRAQLRYASFLYLTQDYDKALDVLKGVDTMTIVKQRLLGYCHEEMGLLEEAEAEMNNFFKMVENKPERILPEDYETMAKIYEKKKEDDKAVEQFNKMFELAREKGKDDEKYADPIDFYVKKAKAYRKDKDFGREAYFRQVVIDTRDPEISLRDYFSLGLAHYTNKDYDNGILAFTKCTELKPDWESGWYWLGSCMYQKDPEAEGWPALEPYTKVYELMKDKPVEDMKKSERSHMEVATGYLAFYHFSPVKVDEPTPEDLHCDDAQEYVDKVLEVNPKNDQVTQISDYCEELRKVQSGGK